MLSGRKTEFDAEEPLSLHVCMYVCYMCSSLYIVPVIEA